MMRNTTRTRSSHHGEKASRWKENQAAISVAMARRRRIFPKPRCTFSKCATCISRAWRRFLYSSEGEGLDGGTEVLSLTAVAEGRCNQEVIQREVEFS